MSMGIPGEWRPISETARETASETSRETGPELAEGLKGRRIALIGGAGFIGHNLALSLKAKGADVSIIDGLEVNNLTSVLGNRDNLPNPDLARTILYERFRLLREAGVDLFVQDARDYHALSHLITKANPQVVVHLAAVSHANRSNKDPYSTFDHSLRTLENALDNAKNRVEHFVYFSSSMVYGHFEQSEVDESTRCEPLGIYGALKYSGERLVMAYGNVFDLPYTIVRPSALYGERCISRRVGQIFIENALLGKPVTVHGDGSDSLDFTYIEDLIQGLELVMATPQARFETFNLTYGAAQSIGSMLEILQAHFPDVEVNRIEKDRLVPNRGTLSVDKARRLLGYEPQWSLDHGYPRYISWYRELFEHMKRAGA